MMIFPTPKPKPAPVRGPVLVYSVVAGATGSAIAAANWSTDRRSIDVQRIVRLPAGLDPVVDWLHGEFPDFPALAADRSVQAVLDTGSGIGQALLERLELAHRSGWKVCELRGRDRQVLSNKLMVAMSSRQIRVSDHSHEDAIRRALADLRKAVDEDGVVGAELTTALALSAWCRPQGVPQIY